MPDWRERIPCLDDDADCQFHDEPWARDPDAWKGVASEKPRELNEEHPINKSCPDRRQHAFIRLLTKASARWGRARRQRVLQSEVVIEGHVFEFRDDYAVVDLETAAGPERRIIDSSMLRTKGIQHEGQPFELRIQEYRFGGNQRWKTVLNPLIPSSKFAPPQMCRMP